MSTNKPFGFANLKAKAMAIIAAAVSTFGNHDSVAQTVTVPSTDGNNTISEGKQLKVLKPKLTLKLNMANPDNSLLAFHSSHRSHSSHSSHSSHYSSSSSYTPSNHSSHSSHSSHYSSSSYSPAYTPSYTPAGSSGTHSSTGHAAATVYNPTAAATYYELGSRTLYKGCQGSDVKALQGLLIKLGYKIIVTGYFGDKTEIAVKKYQQENDLMPDGRVGPQTLEMIKTKANGM